MGGYIRDSLRGAPSKDIDIAVSGDPIPIANELAGELGGTYIILGHTHQIARIIVPLGTRGWTIDLSTLHGSIQDDIASRDFTIDAMALPIGEWGNDGWEQRILDPFGGTEDLRKGIIRAVTSKVFEDDPLRLLRAVRLSASLGFSIEPDTAGQISQQAHLVTNVAGERIRDEFLAILALEGAKTHLQTLDELGLLCRIMPELELTKGVDQPREHYWDVFGHSINAVEAVERVTARKNGDSVSSVVPLENNISDRFHQEISDGHNRLTFLKLGALLHDIAKPQTKVVAEDGRTRFFGHQTLGAKMSKEILQRLRVGNRGVDSIYGLVENHLRPTQMTQGGEDPTPRAVYRFFRDVGDVAIDTLYLSLADHLAARGPDLDREGWRCHTEMVGHVLNLGENDIGLEKMPKLLDGDDLITEFGLAPGPTIGHLLEEVREAQSTGEIATRGEALDMVRSKIMSTEG